MQFFAKYGCGICSSDWDPLEWWKVNANDYPVLATMARDYLAAHATSVALEQVFSSGRDLITSERCSLNPTTIKKAMLYKHWKKTLQ